MSDNIEVVENQARTVLGTDDITSSQEQKIEMQAFEDNMEHNEKSSQDTVPVNQCITYSNEHKMLDENGSNSMVEKKASEPPTKTKPIENSPKPSSSPPVQYGNSLVNEDGDNHQQVECSNEPDINTTGIVTGQKNIVQDMKKLDIVDKSHTLVTINKQSNSLKNLMSYDSSDSNSEDSEDDSEDNSSSTESESDSDTTVEVSDDDDSDSDVEEVATLNKKNNSNTNRIPTTTDILDPVDFSLLPDLKKLNINYENEEFLPIGRVKAIILDTAVTVEALPGVPAYNLDTIFFMKDANDQQHHPLGVVDDVIGPVESPLYCLRFQTAEELTEKGVTVGTEVYVAPKNDCTKYVFIKELMKIKGSDASWIGDKELPPEMANESDEEIECDTDAARQAPKRKFGHQQDSTKMNTDDFNSRFRGRPRRGFQRAPGHVPAPLHSHQNMQRPYFQEYGSAPNYNAPAPFDPSQPPPMLPSPMHSLQGPWMPPPPPMVGPQFGPPMMRGGPRYPPRHYGPFGPGRFGPGPSERPF